MTRTNQSQKRARRRDLFRGEISKNEVILQNIYVRMEITGDLCGVYDKTDAEL